jgi:phosphoenolpyruvate carboxylase
LKKVNDIRHSVQLHIRPTWFVPQYRHALDRHGDQGYDREAQQQVLRPSFEGIRDSVRDLLATRLDKLKREFATTTQDVKVKKEIERLAKEYEKLKEPWRFVSK